MLVGYLVPKAHENKMSTAMPFLSGLPFSMAIIFTSPGVDVRQVMKIADNTEYILLEFTPNQSFKMAIINRKYFQF